MGGVKNLEEPAPRNGNPGGTHNAREGPERDRAPGPRLPPEVIPVGGEAVDARVSTVSPSISHEVMGPDAMIFVF